MNRWFAAMIFSVVALSVALVITVGSTPRTVRHLPPQPIEQESHEILQRRLLWMESLHNHAPGTDWRAIDAATRVRLAQLRARQSTMMAQGVRPSELAAVPVGVWREQGGNNWAGRASAVDYDPATDRVTVLAHGGQLWRAARSSLKWQSLNDSRFFEASGNAQNFVRLNGAGATQERFVAVDDSGKGIFYSDNDGQTWTASTGLNFPNWNGTTYMVARDPNGTELYATINDYNSNVTPNAYQVHLVESNDRGATWNDLGFIDSPQKVALFAMGQSTGLVYLLDGNVLSQVNTGTTKSLTSLGAITAAPAQTASDSVGLAGGMTGTTPFFYAFFETNGTSTTPLVSTNGGTTWTQTATNVPAISYIRVAAGTSLSNPLIACYGSVDLYCTTDGGATFKMINDWPDYYPSVATKLHADISFVKSYLNLANQEVFFIGTDGGIFESTTGMTSVSNDNPTGLLDSQYYGSYTGRTPPYFLAVGAQDQGYQNNPGPATGATAFSQLISGDYADLTSSNGGATLWLNYAGTTLVDPAAASHPLYTAPNMTVFPSWDFKTNGLDTSAMLFFPPLLAMPSNPNSALLSTAINTGSGDTFQITQLNWDGNGNNNPTSANGTYNFGSNVTAIASDGTNYYATANLAPGGAAFYSTTTPTGTWTPGATTLPQGQYLTGLSIVADPVRASTVYVGGSGYSNVGVYVSTNGGGTFNAMSNGLPNTLVYALTITPDGNKLFAATEVGPYFCDLSGTTPTWTYIGTGAPTNIFWNVEYIPALNLARFSTYGRGIWDYDMGGGDLIFRDGFE